MKINQKGQILVETLVVSLMIVSILMFLFVQLRNINQSYKNRVTKNTVSALYAAEALRSYLIQDANNPLAPITALNGINTYYVVPASSVSKQQYYNGLLSEINVKLFIISKEDTTELRDHINNNVDPLISTNLKKFINETKSDKDANTYRMFLELNNGDFASIKVRI
jgi:hypothetical protein